MKRLSILLVSLFFTQLAFAQSPLTFGPKLGANFSTLKSSDPDRRITTEYFTGGAAGVFLRGNLGFFYIQPELYFNEQGSNLSLNPDPADPNATDFNGRVRLTTMDVPLLFGIRLIPLDKFNLRILAGPVYTRVLNERVNDLRILDPTTYNFNKENLGYQAGAGIDIGKLTFDVRYQGSLSDFNQPFDQRSSIVHASLGFKLF
jgi:hypothetical protein